MGKPIFITDPVVAAAYHVHPGEFAWIADNVEALWLVLNHHGYDINQTATLPAAYYVHASAPLPFVPFPALDLPNTQPAKMTVTVSAAGGTFTLTFGGQVDTAAATGRFVVIDTFGVILASGTYAQPPGTTFAAAAGLLATALVPFAAAVTVVQNGAALTLTGNGGKTIGAVAARLTVPRTAAQEAPPPAPGAQTITVGPEDSITRVDVDGDGRADVLIVTDRPPQNP